MTLRPPPGVKGLVVDGAKRDMSKIDFNTYDSGGMERHLRELASGQLPGRWGLLQNLVGHWAIPAQERGVLRYGKAALDSLGSLISYRDRQKKVVEGGRNPTRVWLSEQGFVEAIPDGSSGFGSFVRGVLADCDFREKRIRAPLGELDEVCLRELEIARGRVAYFLDVMPGKRPDPTFWLGPYCQPEDRDEFLRYLRDTVWDRLGTKTLLLEPGDRRGLYSEDAVRLSAVPDEFDFISARDAFNDVVALATRCRSFLAQGRSRTLLFHGPPGTGKSTLARAIARELGAKVVLVSCEAVGRLCDATTVRILSTLEPGVVVLNDVDRSSTSENMALLQGLEQLGCGSVLTVLTVNDVAQLDPAILRPGRVHEAREIPEPSRESREVILRYFLTKLGVDLVEEDRLAFLERSEGFSPADVREFCETAAAVGVPLALEELERIERQRELYAGDRCREFNSTRAAPSVGRRWRARRARAH